MSVKALVDCDEHKFCSDRNTVVNSKKIGIQTNKNIEKHELKAGKTRRNSN